MDWQEVETRRLEVPRSDGYLVYTVDVRLFRNEAPGADPAWRAEASFITGDGRQQVAAEARDEQALMARLRRQIEDKIAEDATYDSM